MAVKQLLLYVEYALVLDLQTYLHELDLGESLLHVSLEVSADLFGHVEGYYCVFFAIYHYKD